MRRELRQEGSWFGEQEQEQELERKQELKLERKER
jgi:hypothetical protein